MDSTQREYIAEAVNFFWGAGTASAHEINDSVATLVYDVLKEAQSCSSSMDLVPRPTYGSAGTVYKITEAAMVGKRIASGDTSMYESCKNQVARAYKSEVKLALMGLL